MTEVETLKRCTNLISGPIFSTFIQQIFIDCHRYFLLSFIELQLFYNVVFIFAVQQNDLVIYIYTFLIFFSIVVYCRIVNGVP